MHLSGENRYLLACMLCLGMFVNTLLCSHHHATHAAFNLLLGPQAWCANGDGASPAATSAAPDAAENTQGFNCPLCSPVSLTLGFLLCFGWLLRRSHNSPLPREQRGKIPPRHVWPALNPRAP